MFQTLTIGAPALKNILLRRGISNSTIHSAFASILASTIAPAVTSHFAQQ